MLLFDNQDGELYTDTDLPDAIELEENTEPYRRHPAFKYVAGILLFAFLAFAFPQIQMIGKTGYDFLEKSNVPAVNSIISDTGQAVVTIETIVNPLVSSKVKRGTGFNLSEEGLILTNQHLVIDANRIKVEFADGREYYSEDFWAIEDSDVAFIKLVGNNLPMVSLDMNQLPDPGKEYTVIGNPLGLERIILTGPLESYHQMEEFDYPLMNLRIPCKPGSSGSPVINEDGMVVGVVFAVIDLSLEESIPITLAIPFYYLQDKLNKCLDQQD